MRLQAGWRSRAGSWDLAPAERLMFGRARRAERLAAVAATAEGKRKTRWTADEDRHVRTTEDRPAWEVALTLGRTVHAVALRRSRLRRDRVPNR